MTKFFTFVLLLMGILIAQVICEKPLRRQVSSKAPTSLPSNPSQDIANTSNTETKSSSAPSDKPVVDVNAPWILPGFHKNRVLQLKTAGKKCWRDTTYNVCLTRNMYKTELVWKNRDPKVQVEFEITNGGEDIVQVWKYKGDHVQLTVHHNGSITQYWDFGKSKFEWNKNSNGKISSRWTGTENPESLEEFKKFINSWCENNDYFVGNENCVIYDGKKGDDNPAWILQGFDKNQAPQFDRNGRKCWQDAKYNVCLTKSTHNTELVWKNRKPNVTVKIETFNDGKDIVQEWYSQGYHVQLNIQKNGSMSQHWQLGKSRFEVRRKTDGKTSSRWYGSDDPKGVEEFKKFIDSWCDSNDFFVEKNNCLIYSK